MKFIALEMYSVIIRVEITHNYDFSSQILPENFETMTACPESKKLFPALLINISVIHLVLLSLRHQDATLTGLTVLERRGYELQSSLAYL